MNKFTKALEEIKKQCEGDFGIMSTSLQEDFEMLENALENYWELLHHIRVDNNNIGGWELITTMGDEVVIYPKEDRYEEIKKAIREDKEYQ